LTSRSDSSSGWRGPLTSRSDFSSGWRGPFTSRSDISSAWRGPLTSRSDISSAWRGPLTSRSDMSGIETTAVLTVPSFLRAWLRAKGPVGHPSWQLCRLGKYNLLRQWRWTGLMRLRRSCLSEGRCRVSKQRGCSLTASTRQPS
jgi:hypothetical protein